MRGIEKLNQEIKECKKCRLYETRKNTLCGEGGLDSKLMLVAQAPGETEYREGRMFIGPSGKKLDELLDEVGVGRNEIYMTNLVKCMLPKYRRPKEDEIQTCVQYLDKEIELINPKVIVPLGYYSIRYIFERYKIPLPNPKPKFSEVYGKLFRAGTSPAPTLEKKILPLQHPAALLYNKGASRGVQLNAPTSPPREPWIKEEMIKNYRKLRTLMVDCKWFPVCPMKWFYDEGRLDKKWVELYCKGDWESCVRYWKEEKGEPHSDWMLPDGSIDERSKYV